VNKAFCLPDGTEVLNLRLRPGILGPERISASFPSRILSDPDPSDLLAYALAWSEAAVFLATYLRLGGFPSKRF